MVYCKAWSGRSEGNPDPRPSSSPHILDFSFPIPRLGQILMLLSAGGKKSALSVASESLGDSHSVPAHFWESDVYTFIPCHGFRTWACHWLKWTIIWQRGNPFLIRIAGTSRAIFRTLGLSNQITVDSTQDFLELACLDGPNMECWSLFSRCNDFFDLILWLCHGQRRGIEKG